MRDYWRDCVAEAFEDAGIAASAEQIDTVASWVEGAHDNYGQAVGHDIASCNLRAAEERERDNLRNALEAERAKVTCKECRGSGSIVTAYGTRVGSMECWKCGGDGRHAP